MSKNQWDFINAGHVFGGDDRFFRHIAKERDLAFHFFGEETVGTAEQNVGLNSDTQ